MFEIQTRLLSQQSQSDALFLTKDPREDKNVPLEGSVNTKLKKLNHSGVWPKAKAQSRQSCVEFRLCYMCAVFKRHVWMKKGHKQSDLKNRNQDMKNICSFSFWCHNFLWKLKLKQTDIYSTEPSENGQKCTETCKHTHGNLRQNTFGETSLNSPWSRLCNSFKSSVKTFWVWIKISPKFVFVPFCSLLPLRALPQLGHSTTDAVSLFFYPGMALLH